MALETKQLPKEIVDNLISYKNNYTNSVYNLGELHMRISSLKKELKKMEEDTILYLLQFNLICVKSYFTYVPIFQPEDNLNIRLNR